ncbi:helix-turn-helix domain-containing protein [Pseudoalteromonas xiamenensis]|uniref:helix-turn-helix domain-containing protein n=1 Tax=Pseudoalteromonas xiamenensis TaxID=882626 RepID=UPI0035E5CB8C
MQSPEEYEITERVNALVKGLKKRRGYTKKDISQKLGIGLTTFNDYLNGVSSFKLGTLIKFAALCKLTLPDILDDTLEAKKLYSEDLADRANTGKNTLDFLAVALMLPVMISAQDIITIVCILLFLLSVFARKDLKNQYLVLMFFAFTVLEKIIFYPIQRYVFPLTSGFIDNIIAFGIQFIMYVFLFYLTKNRIEISLRLTKGRLPQVMQHNLTDAPIAGLLLLYIALHLAAFIENLIRHLDKFGVDEEFAKQFWKVQFIYDNYELFNITLVGFTIAVLYFGINIQKRQDKQSAVFQSQESI